MYIQLKECMNDSFTGDYEDMNKKQLLCVVNNLEKVRDTCVYVKSCNFIFLILWRIYIH